MHVNGQTPLLIQMQLRDVISYAARLADVGVAYRRVSDSLTRMSLVPSDRVDAAAWLTRPLAFSDRLTL